MSDLVKSEGLPITNVQPDFLAEEEKFGLTEIARNIVFPRVKIIQSNADPSVLDKFGPGDVIATGLDLTLRKAQRNANGKVDFVATRGLHLTPLYFFNQWLTMNDVGLNPAILGSSLDENSDIAKKAANANTREEPHPQHPNKKITHFQTLNFICEIHDAELENPIKAVISFGRTEFKTGMKFCGLIAARNKPVVAGVYKLSIVGRSNEKGNWFGFNIENAGWVGNAEQYNRYKEEHMLLAKSRERIIVDHENEPIATNVEMEDKFG